MIFKEIQSKRLQIFNNTVSLFLILGAALCVITPNSMVLKNWASYSSQITLAYWVLGLIFLALKNHRLTMTAFVSCAFLCIYLKSTTNPAMQLPDKTGEPTLKIAQFNLSTFSGDYYSIIASLKKVNADIISFQEVTPDWNKILRDSLNKLYPHQCDYQSLDIYSLKVLSKYSFAKCDTLFCENVPSLVLGFENKINNQQVCIISTYIAPPLFSSAYQQMQRQFDTLAYEINKENIPTLTVGDYNIHASSNEIQAFRHAANLNDSRRGYRPAEGHFSLLEVPTEHIFFNNYFSCLNFQIVTGIHSERLGIVGTYQFVKDPNFVVK